MRVDEFLAKLKIHVDSHNMNDWCVCVPISGEGGIGGQKIVEIIGVCPGFDHDHGKFMLYPEVPLFKKPQKTPKSKK